MFETLDSSCREIRLSLLFIKVNVIVRAVSHWRELFARTIRATFA